MEATAHLVFFSGLLSYFLHFHLNLSAVPLLGRFDRRKLPNGFRYCPATCIYGDPDLYVLDDRPDQVELKADLVSLVLLLQLLIVLILNILIPFLRGSDL